MKQKIFFSIHVYIYRYGFRGNPQLWLVAKPKVGEREVTMSHITEWIEKKLAMEFQVIIVYMLLNKE